MVSWVIMLSTADPQIRLYEYHRFYTRLYNSGPSWLCGLSGNDKFQPGRIANDSDLRKVNKVLVF